MSSTKDGEDLCEGICGGVGKGIRSFFYLISLCSFLFTEEAGINRADTAMSLVWLPEIWVLALVICGWVPMSCGMILLWTSFYSHLPTYVSRKGRMMKCSVSEDFSAPRFLFLCCQLFSCKRRKGQTSALKLSWIPFTSKDGSGSGVRVCKTGACLSAGPGGRRRQSRISTPTQSCSSGLIRRVSLCHDQQRL